MAIISAYQAAQKEVNLLVDGKKWQVHTFYSDVAGVLQENGIDLGKKDRVNPDPNAALADGMTVEVRRAVPVQLQVGSEKYQLLSSAETVGEVLEEEGVVLGERDQVTPDPDTRLAKETSIQVDRITTRVVEEEVPIPYRIQRETDATLFNGIVRVINNGKEGLEKKIWEIVYKNGKEAEKKLLASTVIEEPVDRVVRVGTMRTVTRGGNTIRFSRAYDMVATAYTYTGNNTATGVSPRVGVVAVDPSVIPMGSRLYVEGYGYCTAMDKGRAIRGNRIDVFLESRSQALSWGRRTVKVYLLD